MGGVDKRKMALKITKKITINIEFRMLDFCSSTYFEGRFVI